MHILVGNGGNPSIALLQWAIENSLKNSYFVSIDTGWAARHWHSRVDQIQAYASSHQILPVRLKSPISFASLIQQRKEFPSQEFKWCASLLKGSVLNAWLDEIDPDCLAVILLAKQKTTASRYETLPTFINDSEYYGSRKVWYPLVDHTLTSRNALIARTPFELLTTRSLECDPCIFTTTEELSDMQPDDLKKLRTLEQDIGQSMCKENLTVRRYDKDMTRDELNISHSKEMKFLEAVSMGCGSPWACGE